MNPPTIRFTARAPRGTFGRIALWSFWAFQALMLLLTLGNCSFVLPYAGNEDPEVATGALWFSALLGAGVLAAWPIGTVILGLAALLTRGRKLVLEHRQTSGEPPAGA